MHPQSGGFAFCLFNLAKVGRSRYWFGLLNKCLILLLPHLPAPQGSEPFCGPSPRIGFGCDPLSQQLHSGLLNWFGFLCCWLSSGWPSLSGLDQLSTA